MTTKTFIHENGNITTYRLDVNNKIINNTITSEDGWISWDYNKNGHISRCETINLEGFWELWDYNYDEEGGTCKVVRYLNTDIKY